MRFRFGLVPVLLAAACASPEVKPPAPVEAPPPVEAAPKTPPEAPTLRLPASVKPVGYELSLTVDPAKAAYSGKETIAVTISEPTEVIWLYDVGHQVTNAEVRTGAGALPAKVLADHPPFVGFWFDAKLPAGNATLSFEFTGVQEEKGAQGLFRQNENGEWYAFTQFEAEYARRAFPGFDEPGYKVPFTVSLTVPKTAQAFANMPVEREEAGEGGMKTVHFQPTPPLPTYLVAFGVGPFEVVEAGTSGMKQTPVRIIVTKGKKAQAEFAAKDALQQLPSLEAYFGIAYPYPKLDLLEIPLTGTFGAMENPGLVTFVAALMLADPKLDTTARQRSFSKVNAHELAHQWFGDLVTPAWWDDIWLNESFATWMSRKAIEARDPSWNLPIDRVDSLGVALNADALLSARQIVQPITERGDIVNAFDRITYNKGGAVLDMLERFLGADTFREGVRRYLNAHALGNATANDFIGALVEASGKPEVKQIAESFLTQPGSPLVTFGCADKSKPELQLAQQRYVPLGEQPKGGATWSVPLCVRYPGKSGKPAEACRVFSETKASWTLPDADQCPAWLVANVGAKGYYRSRLAPEQFTALTQPKTLQTLSGPEQMMLLLDAGSLMHAGMLPAEQALDVAAKLAGSRDRGVLENALELAAELDRALVPEAERARHARMVEKLFGARARTTGLQAKKGESVEVTLVRPRLVLDVADRGEDLALRKQAAALAGKWLQAPASVDPQMAETLLESAALGASAELNGQLQSALAKTTDRRARAYLLNALGHVRDPKLVESNLGLLLAPEVDPRESGRMLEGFSGVPGPREQAFAYAKAHWDEYAKRFTEEGSLFLPRVLGGAFCDEAHRAEVEAFFGPKYATITGGKRVMAQTLERIDRCIALVKSQGASVGKYLQRY